MGKRVSVYSKTYNGTAIAGSYYTASTGQVTVPVGATRVRVSIPVLSDNRAEPIERMRVEISRPSASAIADRVGVGTIVDDD